MKNSDSYWQSYLNIEDEVLSLSRLILFTDGPSLDPSVSTGFDVPDQMSTCSDYIADLIVRCSTQIESIMKTLYKKIRDDYGLPPSLDSKNYKKDTTNIGFNGPCYEIVNEAFHIEDVVVQINQSQFDLKKEENVNLKPLSKKAIKSNKDGWGRAYQNLKHNRIQSLKYGNLGNLLSACAALYLLNIYLKYYDEPAGHTTRSDYNNQSYSFGSRIFSLVKPKIASDLETKNNPERTPESPFIARFGRDDFYEIQKKYAECTSKSLDFFRQLKEFNSPEFNAYFADLQNKNPTKNYTYTVELIKYRIKNRIDKGTTFDEKKKILITSEEWKRLEKSISPALKADDITIDTIDEMIDRVGLLFASSVEVNLSIRPFMDYADTKKMELVISPDTMNWDKNK